MTESTPHGAPSADPAPVWHASHSGEVLEALAASMTGLTAEEADRRLDETGRNELDLVGATPWWTVLLRQFISPMVAILLVAGVVTLVQRHVVDAGAIFLILSINAALGFWQERKAESDVRALQSLSTPSCRVLRDGREQSISAPLVVPGDIVLLESGERVPADVRLIEANALQVDESMLTGESLAATKTTHPVPRDATAGDRSNILFSGTFVTSGRGRGVVVATGNHTELGEINRLVQGPSAKTPMQVLTDALERRIGVVVLAGVAVVFTVGLLLGNSPSDMLRTSVALAVASIPEGLPIVLTVAMSVGVSRMAKRGAIIRFLPAVETLGSTDVIASDKTGTLTRNELTVEKIWTSEGVHDLPPPDGTGDQPFDPYLESPLVRDVLRAGALTNEATRDEGEYLAFSGDAVDAAMAHAAVRHETVDEDERRAEPEAHLPYEPDIGYSQTVRTDYTGRRVLYVKGSPDALVEMSVDLADAHGTRPFDRGVIEAANQEMASRGLRVIATAARVLPADEQLSDPLPAPSGLTFLGLSAMTDPPRPGVLEAIGDCQRAGIAIKMITGDHPATATAIARRLGLPTDAPALTGAELAELDDDALAARLNDTSVAARVTPKDKLRIVRALQRMGKVVAVTGDGVNDAPALKAAAIGVAMGRSGTDVARESADLVLTDDNFVTIVHAVEQGRVTFASIRKATYFLLSTGVGGFVAVALSVLADQPLLFLPVQMLWINLVTNGVQDLALALEPAEGDELTRKPRPRSEGVLSRTLWFRMLITGTWMATGVLLTFAWALWSGLELEHARTLALTAFVLFNFFQAMSSRAEYRSVFRLNPLRNKPLLLSSLGALTLQWVAMNWSVLANLLSLTPLTALEWLACVLIGSTVLVIVEGEKFVRRWSHRRDGR